MAEREHQTEIEPSSEPALRPGGSQEASAVLRLRDAIGNRAFATWIARQPSAETRAEIDRLIREGDWFRAAQALSPLPAADIEPIVSGIDSPKRQYLVEGARHGQGVWDADKVISAVDKVAHRDAVIGSVRFFVWKHMWKEAGVYLCGLSNEDIRRVAKQLALTWDDLRAIADSQDKPQQERLSLAFFGQDLEFIRGIPKDLAGKDADVLGWLNTDEIVRPYAQAKWTGGAKPKLTIIGADKWVDEYVKRGKGKVDPATGQTVTDEELRSRAVKSEGVTTDDDEIIMKGGENTPAVLIHEAMHALAPSGFEDAYGRPAEEGAAEYFARRVARSASKHPSKHYDAEVAAIAALAAVVGEKLLAEAYFTGKTLRMQGVVEEKKGGQALNEWRRAMNDPGELKNAPAKLK